jgi:CHAT domain-containing protein/tetratricopeptide (TPR) repeat protein
MKFWTNICVVFFVFFTTEILNAQEVNRIEKLNRSILQLAVDKKWSQASDSTNVMAKLHAKDKNYPKALEWFNKELQFRKLLPDTGLLTISKSKLYFNLVSINRSLAHYEEADRFAKEALEYNEKYFGKNTQEYADVLFQLSVLYYSWRKLDEYRKNYKDLISSQSSVRPINQKKLAEINILYANHFIEMGDFAEAEKLLQTSFMKLDPHQDAEVITRIYNNLGALREFQSRYYEALMYFQKALKIRLEIGGSQQLGVAKLFKNIAVSFFKLNQYLQAETYFVSSLQLFETLLGDSHPDFIETKIYWIENQLKQNKLVQAKTGLSTLKQTVLKEVLPDLYIKYLHCNALLSSLSGQLTKSIEFYELSEKYIKEIYEDFYPDLAWIFYQKAILYYKINQNENAIKSLINASRMNYFQKECIDPLLQIDILKFELEMNPKLDTILLRKAIQTSKDIILKTDLESDLTDQLTHIRGFVHSFFKKISVDPNPSKYYSIIFEILQWSNSVRWNKFFNEVQSIEMLDIESSSKKNYISLKKEISFLEREWRAAIETDINEANQIKKKWEKKIKEWTKLKSEILEKYPTAFDLLGEDTRLKITGFQSNLKKEEVFLHYFHFENDLFLFTIQKQNIGFFKLNFDPQLISQFKREIFEPDFENKSSDVLYQDLVKYSKSLTLQLLPLDLLKQNVSTFYIVKDGPLCDLPFEILFSKHSFEVNSNFYKDLPFLLKKVKISYPFSIQQFVKSNSESVQYLSQFHFFSGTYKTVFNSLPSIQSEQKYLSEIFNKVSIYQSVINFYKDINHISGIIQLSMHAKLDSLGNPFLYTSDDHCLSLKKIASLDLEKCQLLLLGACQSASGTYEEAEGMISLSKAFSWAGAKAVIASLWKLNDKSTSEITRYFFNHIAKEKSKDESLQQAKLEFLQKAGNLSAHPYFWASLIISGNIDPLVIYPWYLRGQMIIFPILMVLLILTYYYFRKK